MTSQADSAAGSNSLVAWGNGLIGVIIFSASLPATKIAVADFDPWFLTSVRAVIAALFSSFFLLMLKQKVPTRSDLVPLSLVALGVVFGFPLFTGLALEHVTSAHSIVFIGLLPMATAIFGVLRAGENPRPAFWLFSILGAALVAGYALFQDAEVSLIGDSYMVAAIVLCGLGYAEGAKLSKTIGGWQVISWALLLSLPVMAALTVWFAPSSFETVTPAGWMGLTDVSLFSMMIGFVFWYRGLAMGGIAKVGQLQLLQPFFALALASMLLNEPVDSLMILITFLVIGCVIGVKRFA